MPSPQTMNTRANPMAFTRRQMLQQAGSGAGMLGLISLLNDQGLLTSAKAQPSASNPMAARQPHFAPKAKRVIWLFINGGPSQVDTFDYKPELAKRDGQELEGFDANTGFFANAVGPLMKSPWAFRRYGQSGKWVSDLFPHMAQHVDKMAFIHSCYSSSNNHSPALFKMNTGHMQMGYPCVGSWATYGLGATTQNLPGFVVMSDPLGRGLPKGYTQNWSAGFLPSVYQGTWLRPSGDPILNLYRHDQHDDPRQRRQLDLLRELNEGRIDVESTEDTELAARIESFELAYRMQTAAPEALNVEAESQHIQQLYGLDDDKCSHFGRQCLTARRMVERGVRFVQIYSGGEENQRSWDGHNDIEGNHGGFAAETDKPIAGLLADLQQRGMLEDTLVIWGGEFGRLPLTQKADKPGRDHNPHAFTVWMAGAGIKGGTSYGESDEIGHKAANNPVDIHDLHATILHLLGMDHERLTFLHNGRRFRLTDVSGNVVTPILT
ncbi:MAG: DUF1501 domain-containing protein [Phycisphaeraceae bacterium]